MRKDIVPDNFMCSPQTMGVASFYILQLLNLDLFYGTKISVLQIPMQQYGFNLATRSLVERAHRHNIAVHYWTVNDVEDMKYLIEIGADGIVTDYPHKLAEVYAQIPALL
jgi:glycerophosphoryl diester phosphodiesterase